MADAASALLCAQLIDYVYYSLRCCGVAPQFIPHSYLPGGGARQDMINTLHTEHM